MNSVDVTVADARGGAEPAPASRPRVRPRQGLIGLTLCALVLGAWLALHVCSVFFFPLEGENWLLAPVIVAVQCWLTVGLFIIAHDAMHGSLAPFRPRVNARIGAAILFLYAGFGWRKVRAAHMAHHHAPGTDADPDFFAGDPERFWPWFKTFFARYFGLGSVLFVSSVVTIYLAILGARVENVVLFYGLPSLLSSLQLFYFGTYLPHRHEKEGFSDRHNARSNEFGTLASLLTCFHFGYHHEHHLSPYVPWWALPQEHRRTKVG
ncbi:MAG TPA: fatty acid desaturase [Mesorhizobium sp.]|jgi:beta-carotene ketolase (CrtW type)|nr:fatty acid desaturase [Mesorhizobium sp.]